MVDQIAKGTWVQIHRVVLAKGQRAPKVPGDTQDVPLEMLVKGFLAEAANVGEEAEIITPVGRRMQGVLKDVNPGYTHSFGPQLPEILTIGSEVRAILREEKGSL